MTIMIVFPERPSAPTHFMCGDEAVYLRSEVSGLKALKVDTLVLLPGCSKEQKDYAVERTKASKNPVILQ